MAFGGSTPSVHSGGPTYASSCGPPSTTSGGPPPAPYGANGPPLSFSAVTQPGHQDRNDPFNQYPPEVNERRRHLVPIMKQARREGNRANLVRDKLYINNRLYKAHFPSQQFELKATGLPASFGRPTLAPPSTVTPAYTRDSESTSASVPSSAARNPQNENQLSTYSSSEEDIELEQATTKQGSDCVSFKTKSGLQRHVSVHGAFEFKCEVCDTEFHNKHNLKQHIERKHTAYQNLCSQCAKTFSTQYALKKHERTVHEKSPMFKCSLCDKVFPRKEVLNAHCTKDMTGKKPYNVTVVVGFKNTLIRHMKTCISMPKKPKPAYVCEICQKQFKLARLLKQHKRVHEPPRFSCQVCDQYPPEVNERQRHLVPIMKQARREGSRANLVRDKLYIDNRL
ncbi:LOW QUALITY PROTEIN: ZN320-like protein [Mya arenaria]|uniref:ZN320-like protein n=1 Tax=Mya arenaria TaxID=6604 RepID=A0ABY7DTN0_MYAAR|nr:LOW QUALITY PROTEIN: ZN320-like protein [Mya arenaria]